MRVKKNRKIFLTIFLVLLLALAFRLYKAIPSKAAWYNTSWLYRKELVFNNAASTTNLTDFPVMVKLTSSNFTFSQAKTNGEDIRFTDTDGSTLLPYEFENYDSSGQTATIWVKVPQINAASSTDSIYMYWGNSGAADAQSADNTWNANYKGVYHLNDNAASTTVTDSSGNSNNITANENTNATSYVSSGQNAGAFLTAGNPINIQHYLSVKSEQIPDIALDTDNHPVVSYYDTDAGNLNITHCNDRNCKGGDESVTSPDTSNAVGQYPSIELDTNGYPVIAHYDATNFDLRLTHCNDINCTGVETTTAVDSTGTVGLYPSLALDSSNFPVIAYYDTTNTALKFVHCNDLYCVGDVPITLDGSGADNVGGLQNSISMVLDGSGFPVITYYDNTNTDLKFIHCDDANCVGETPITIASSANDIGRNANLVLDGSGLPMIVYGDQTGRDTYYIHCDDANCTGVETSVLIDATLADYPRIRMQSNGNPIIVYMSNLVYLRYAVCSTPACTSTSQNYLTLYNQYSTNFPSFVIASDGALAITYYPRAKYDGFYDVNVLTTDHKLERVYDSDLDFGTGSFSFSAWFKTQGLNKSQQNTILSRYDTDQGFKAYLNYSGQPCVGIDDDATWGPDDGACTIPSSYYPNVDNGNATNPQLLAMTLDSNSYPMIAYYEANTTDLEYIHCNDINCAGNDESFVSLESAGTAGQYPSIVTDSLGYPVISYYTVGSGIKVIHCGNANCSSGNTSNVIEAAATTNTFTSIKLDSLGYPVIAYYDNALGDLKLAHCTDVNCATPVTPTTVDNSSAAIGAYPSLELDSSGFPVISYQDVTNLNLMLAHCGNATCSAGNTITTTESTGQTGYYTSMELDSNGYPVIAYYYNNAFNLQIMHCNDVNCAGANENINTAFQDFDGGNNWMTLKLNNSGYPVILHTSLGYHTQILTTCNDVNCAGDDETHNYIREDVHNISHSSLALDSSGFPVIVTRSGSLDISLTRPGTATYSNTNTVDDGAWHHMVGVKNGTTSLTLYIDGVAVATDSSIAASGTLTSNSATLNLAEDIVGGYSINGLDGYLDEVQIDNTARSSDWVKAQFLSESNNFINVKFTQYGAIANALSNFTNNSGALKNNLIAHYKFDEGYGTTNNNSGSIGSAINNVIVSATRSNEGKLGKAIKLSALQYIYTPDNSNLDFGTGDFTISTWIKTGTVANNKNLFNKGAGAGTSGWRFGLLNGVPDVLVGDTIGGTEGTLGSTSIADDTWHHLAVSFSRSSNAVGYVDGKQVGTLAISTRNGSVDNSANLNIGNSFSNFEGLIDEVKIYNTALTADEIKQDFNKTSTLGFGSFSDTSSISGGSVASNSASAQYCVPGSTDPCSPPLAEWNFEEGSGSTANDNSGNGNSGTITGAIFGAGKIGKSISFSGGTDEVSVSSSITTNTIEFWTNPSTTTQNLIDLRTAATAANISVSSGTISATGFTSPIIYVNGVVSSTLAAGTWQHVSITTSSSITANAIKFGRIGSTSLTGSLDSIKIYNYVRTPAQIAWNYNQGGPIAHWKLDECTGTTANDSSGNGLSGTISIGASGTNTTAGTCTTSGAWFDGATGKFNSSLDFDGTDDQISMGDPASGLLDMGTSDFTLSAWIKTSDTTSQARIINKRDTSAIGYELNLAPSVSSLNFFIGDSGGFTFGASGGVNIRDNVWHHVAVTFDRDGNGTYYVDGKIDGTPRSISTRTGTISNATSFYIGRISISASNFFPGLIDDVRIYNYALTPQQMKNIYNNSSAIRFGP